MTTTTSSLVLEDPYVGLDPLIRRCKDEGGLVVTTLLELREALGYGRLGKWVLAEIAGAIQEKGLGYFPTAILTPEINTQPRQYEEVWLYIRDDSPTARVIDAVLDPKDHDDVRTTLVAVRLDDEPDLTPEQKLERIRAIIG